MIKKCLIGICLLLIFGCSNNKANISGEKEIPAKDFKGLVFTAEQNFSDVSISNCKSFGKGGFGEGGPFCEMYANEKYTSKYGNTIEKGESFTIGKAIILPNTDGYGNTGTKLILATAAPKEGLAQVPQFVWEKNFFSYIFIYLQK